MPMPAGLRLGNPYCGSHQPGKGWKKQKAFFFLHMLESTSSYLATLCAPQIAFSQDALETDPLAELDDFLAYSALVSPLQRELDERAEWAQGVLARRGKVETVGSGAEEAEAGGGQSCQGRACTQGADRGRRPHVGDSGRTIGQKHSRDACSIGNNAQFEPKQIMRKKWFYVRRYRIWFRK